MRESFLKDLSLVRYPKTKRGEATLAKIIKAAEQVIGKKGYHKASINDIAYKAKVAPGTFYIYFSDKYSLYCYILKQYNHIIRQTISQRIKKAESYIDRERLGLLAFLELIREKPYMYNIIWESLYVDKALFVEYYETFSHHYAASLEQAQRNDDVIDVDSTIMAYTLMGISNFIGLKYVLFDKDADLEMVADEVTKIIENGIIKRDGRPERTDASS